jgi:hypothetical protein
LGATTQNLSRLKHTSTPRALHITFRHTLLTTRFELVSICVEQCISAQASRAHIPRSNKTFSWRAVDAAFGIIMHMSDQMMPDLNTTQEHSAFTHFHNPQPDDI